MDCRSRIVVDPEVPFGKPVVRGTRITVGDVLSYLASGMSEDQILGDFPQLTREDLRARLAFAADRERRWAASLEAERLAGTCLPPGMKLLFGWNLAARVIPDLANTYQSARPLGRGRWTMEPAVMPSKWASSTLVVLALAMAWLVACCAGGAAPRPAQAPREVSFATDDGGVVFADEYGAGERSVVLVHGGRFDRSSWKAQAPVLASAGLRVLALDLRGRGASRAGSEGPEALHLDVLAAVRHLRASGAASVSVVGASIGGWAAGEAIARGAPGEVERLVLLAYSPVDAPERLSGRKLFVVARDDTSGSGVPRLQAIRAQFDRAPEPKELRVLEGSAHAQLLFDADQGERLLRHILDFLLAP